MNAEQYLYKLECLQQNKSYYLQWKEHYRTSTLPEEEKQDHYKFLDKKIAEIDRKIKRL